MHIYLVTTEFVHPLNSEHSIGNTIDLAKHIATRINVLVLLVLVQ